MGDNSTENEVRRPSSAHSQLVNIDEVQEAMGSIKISPRKLLESLSHLRISRAQIQPIEKQGSVKAGGTGDVEAAILISAQPSSSPEPDGSEFVAVKKLRFDTETENIRGLALFANEVGLLNDLSHPNVVKILGFVEDVDNNVAWMVFHWEKNGNLREFVQSEKWELPERVSLVGVALACQRFAPPLTNLQIDDVANGLSYLHGRNPPICHGDLKSLNILVNSENLAVITDFGSARSRDSMTEEMFNVVDGGKATRVQHQTPAGANATGQLTVELAMSGQSITMTGPAWTIRWAAPELLCGGIPGLESDVWAFGWICWEAFTGNFPFDDEHEGAVINRIVTKDIPTIRDQAQLNQIQTLCSLIEECWGFAANERPTALRCQQVISFMDQTTPLRKRGKSLDTASSGGLLYALGEIQHRNHALEEAQKYFRRSLEVCASVGDEGGEARATNAIGRVYLMQNEYSKAEESYTQCRDLYFKMGNDLGFAQSVKALGDVYHMRNEYSKAEKLYIHSRDLYSKIGNQLGFANSAKALGDAYRMR
ncbi:hypothetical protein FS837_002825, partial [Tulasnella sp. UAMH 9824]